MGDGDVSLHGFILSVTAAAEMALHWGVSTEQMAGRNILFDEDENYIKKLLSVI
jgi:phosphotransferase system IIA component